MLGNPLISRAAAMAHCQGGIYYLRECDNMPKGASHVGSTGVDLFSFPILRWRAVVGRWRGVRVQQGFVGIRQSPTGRFMSWHRGGS